jgi:predicted alpha/beta-fold hydrolase
VSEKRLDSRGSSEHWSQQASAASLPAALGLEPFRPRLPWLNGDLQTLRDTLRPVALPPDLGTPLQFSIGSGEQLLGLLDQPLSAAEPLGLVLLMHGLGGSSSRSGLRRMGYTLQRAGFAVLRLNMRGAGAGRELARGTYAANSNADLLPILPSLRQLAQGRPLLGMGISLGGTLLLNALLAEWQEQSPLDGLVCISSPLDLQACSRQIERPRNRLYQRWLLQRLVAQTLADPFGVSAAERQALQQPICSIRRFDALITAPRWGYDSLEAYYRDASPLPRLLQRLTQLGGSGLPPTLIVHADDDPWVPVDAARQLSTVRSQTLSVLLTTGGGHNGFHGWRDGRKGRVGCWGDQLTALWLRRCVVMHDSHYSPLRD